MVRLCRPWGEARGAILSVAEVTEPDDLARTLQLAIETDMGTKTGLGRAVRSLEVLAVRVADIMGRAAAAAH